MFCVVPFSVTSWAFTLVMHRPVSWVLAAFGACTIFARSGRDRRLSTEKQRHKNHKLLNATDAAAAGGCSLSSTVGCSRRWQISQITGQRQLLMNSPRHAMPSVASVPVQCHGMCVSCVLLCVPWQQTTRLAIATQKNCHLLLVRPAELICGLLMVLVM